MKKSIHTLIISAIISVTAVCAQAAEAVSEAVVLSVKGTVFATVPGSTQAVAVKVGDKLPQGSTIKTDDGSAVELQVLPGVVSKIDADSTVDLSKMSLTTANGAVTKQTAALDLRIGSVLSTIDPSKKAINDYSVSTAKGVAAARGTVYAVTVLKDGTVVTTVLRGTVTFTNPKTGQTVKVTAPYSVKVDVNGVIGVPAVDIQNEFSRFEINNDLDTTIIVSPSN